jgi:TonB dependent receptor
MLLSQRFANTVRANYSSQSSNQINSLDNFDGAEPITPSLILGTLPQANNNASFETFDTDYYDFGPIVRNRTRQLNFVDDLTWQLGAHQLKFGGDYRAIWLDKTPYTHTVAIIASSVKDLLDTESAELGTSTRQDTDLLTQSFSAYAQDVWKLTPRLTLTYGLRWELAPAPSPRNQTRLAAWQNVDTPQTISLSPFGTPLWKTTYANLAPRVGLAYRATRNGDLVVRGAFGIFYDLGVGNVADIGSYFPGSATAITPAVAVPVDDPASYLPVISVNPPYPMVAAVSPHLALPRSYQWNAAVEKSFGTEQAFSVTYVGQKGSDLLRQQSLYQPNPSFSSDFILTGNSAWSNYNALQLQYRRPLAGHLQALLNYTWSHSLDNASNDVVAGFAGTVISGASDYASSDIDVRHSFSGAVVYQVPQAHTDGLVAALTSNWSLAGVVVARSGFPFNGRIYSLSPDPGGNALSRPDRIPGQPLWIPDASAGGGKSLNPQALVIPSTVRQGTESRNDIPGFALTQLDLSAGRKFDITERWKLEFRADAFNALNHPNFTNPPAYPEFGPDYLVSREMLNSGLGGLNPLFQEGGPRSLQLSLKLAF